MIKKRSHICKHLGENFDASFLFLLTNDSHFHQIYESMLSGLDNICITVRYIDCIDTYGFLKRNTVERNELRLGRRKIQIEIFVWVDNCVESKCIRAICDMNIRISKLVFCCIFDFRQILHTYALNLRIFYLLR